MLSKKDSLKQRLNLIFGTNYEEVISFHTYRIDFSNIKSPSSELCVVSIMADIYEDDKVLIKDAQFDFYKETSSRITAAVDDISVSCFGHLPKYHHHTHWLSKLRYSLCEIWNKNFKDVPISEFKNGGILDVKA
ncbi:MAG: hypothetical protein E7310_05460 [Clostridiales bacterium]|nr:hypothetical protein [Clostridiales bacterium]